MTELLDTKAPCKTSPMAFLADNTDSYTWGLDHGDVVPTVADAVYAFPIEGTDEPGYIGLLGVGGTTASDYSQEL